MRYSPILALCMILAACVPTEDAQREIGPEVAERAEARCLADDGRWIPRADTGTMTCLRTPRDANEACTTSADCSTVCLARSRTCAPVEPLYGCNDVIGKSGNISTLCIE